MAIIKRDTANRAVSCWTEPLLGFIPCVLHLIRQRRCFLALSSVLNREQSREGRWESMEKRKTLQLTPHLLLKDWMPPKDKKERGVPVLSTATWHSTEVTASTRRGGKERNGMWIRTWAKLFICRWLACVQSSKEPTNANGKHKLKLHNFFKTWWTWRRQMSESVRAQIN